MTEQPESSESGDPIYRHSEPRPPDLVRGDAQIVEAVSGHIEGTIGPIAGVFHELVSPYVHVDVHHVAPTTAQPFHVLATSGMSERAMVTPPECDEFKYAELLICLAPDWEISEEAFKDERHYWPVRLLKQLARLPHEFGTWLGYGHSVPNGDPPEPFAPNTALAGAIVLQPLALPDTVHVLQSAAGRQIRFWSLLPLYPEEMELKLRNGTEALLQRLDGKRIDDVVRVGRPNAAPSRGWWPFG